ncbi:MAG: CpsB/CapC family capsule biosynthesis tyrosine phosphatase [Promethearchaeota archaeon]
MSRIIDYHIHTSFSDGFFSPRDMIQAAAERGIQEVCITDHYSSWQPALSELEFEEYFSTLHDIRRNESLDIKIFIGIEVNLSTIEILDPLQDFQWDLILFEYVFTESTWKKKFHQLLNFKKKNPNYNIGLAHTRFTRVSESDLDYVLNKIRESDIIIELNTSYGNYMEQCFNYLDEEYWYSVGSDAHHKYSLGNTTLAVNFLKSRNIPLSRIISL